MSAQSGAGAPLPPELRPLDDADPRRIGPYTVVGRLGAGGMGTVFGALDDTGACIAVKVVHDKYAHDEAFRAAFAQEVALMRRIQGVYALAVHAADTEAARPWVATDFVPGVTLRAHVERDGPLAPDVLFSFAAGTAEALTAVHAAGVVHCDVKPGNVMLTPDGPRLLDFGIARPASRSAAGRAAGRAFGSPGWVSPERYRGAEPEPPADVFAWGCLVAYAATGRPPFGRGGADLLRRRVLESGPDLDGVPGELRPIVEMAVAPDPAQRPTAESVYRGLIDFATPEDTSQMQTRDLGGRLRGIVARSWPRIDVSWHDPALWVAAAPVVAAAGTGLAAGSALAGAGTAGSGAAAAGGAGAAAAGSAGAGGAVTAAGIAGGTKIAAVAASAVLVVGGVSAGAYLAAPMLADSGAPQPSPSPSPSPTLGPPAEIVAGIVENLESADSYRAVESTVYNDGLPGTFEYVHTAVGGEPVFQTVEIAGTPDDPEFATDRIYRPELQRLIERTWTGGAGDSSASHTAVPGPLEEDTVSRHSRDPVLAPFTGLADSMEATERTETDLDGTPSVRIAGTFDLPVTGAAAQSPPRVGFELWTGLDGLPLRLDYEYAPEDDPLAGFTRSWTYSGFGGLETRLCGAIEGVPRVDRALLVPTVGEIACGEARAAVEEYLAIPDEQKEGTGYIAEVSGGWTCGLSTTAEVLERRSENAGTCYAGELGAAERVDFLRLD
ncbi:serine/threonine protein kinase [Streptomonospora sp. PA3]|uniref:serine/threonine-protein kinase n=1 Tax=Streptomonospora sp. PA3 TaxID=2607326 RepID=UPI0012DBEECD|nr:serine/threonine-protein kinase [Streptomonospora sp. PA3]MUL43892.1 serine/threonine protein kinase [Streptomonospora sp. PA3]